MAQMQKKCCSEAGALPLDTGLSDPDKLIKQLKEYEAAIESNKKTEVYVKCMTGRNLTLIRKKEEKKCSFH